MQVHINGLRHEMSGLCEKTNIAAYMKYAV